jgi:uncharacterized membrane protein
MNKTKKICYIAALTALYVVLSAFLKLPVGVGHIQIDLGYIAFAVALCEFGLSGAIVGVAGCALESMLFTSYGFSISWAVANTIIGIGCGLTFRKARSFWSRAAFIVLFTMVGMVGAKTAIECALYNIPLLAKLPKSVSAFFVDSVALIAGLAFDNVLRQRAGTFDMEENT